MASKAFIRISIDFWLHPSKVKAKSFVFCGEIYAAGGSYLRLRNIELHLIEKL